MSRLLQDDCGRMYVDHGLGWVSPGLGVMKRQATTAPLQVSSELMEIPQAIQSPTLYSGGAARCRAYGGEVSTSTSVSMVGGKRTWCAQSFCKFCDNCASILVSQVCI